MEQVLVECTKAVTNSNCNLLFDVNNNVACAHVNLGILN